MAMTIELSDNAVFSISEVGKITKRRSVEVISDALRTYEWILREQTAGKKIVSKTENREDEIELALLVEDKEAAQIYFGAE
jgi:hypothetical protein